MSDSLAPEAVEPHLRGRFGKPYRYEPECESTQLLLLDSALPEGATAPSALPEGATAPSALPEGAVAATDYQTRGRGRLGRRWEAPPRTAVLCSIMLHPPRERHLPELTLVAAIAAAEAVEAETGLSAQIKWPNDVMLNRRKVAGILAELRGREVVVGIGINVNQTREDLPPGTSAGSLRTVDGRVHDRTALLGSLLLRIERLYDRWRQGGLTALYGELGSRDFLRGRRVFVDEEAGTALQIERDGRLAVEIEGERRLIESGDVSYER